MGIAKRIFEGEQSQGYYSNIDKTVCTSCFNDEGLKLYIEEHQSHSKCSYCDEDMGDDIVACELNSLVAHIIESIQCEWGNPAEEGLPYESREGGWQVLPVYDTWDLLDLICLENTHGETYEDICNSIDNQEWCKRNPYSVSTDKRLLYGWEQFTSFVKFKARYVFFKAENQDYNEGQHDEMNPVEILDTLGEIFNEIGLIEEIDPSTKIIRARIVDPDISLSTAQELGSPPIQFSTMANRMSPAGIPMFYGAFDDETAIKETYEECENTKKAITGVFEPARPLKVIDLSKPLYIPSLFNEYERDRRDFMGFLSDFINDFTKPIQRKDRAHIDYVPTQIVTEYIRYILTTENNYHIDGVIYPSSKNVGKRAIVIFANSEQCVEANDLSTEDAILELVKIEDQILYGKYDQDTHPQQNSTILDRCVSYLQNLLRTLIS